MNLNSDANCFEFSGNLHFQFNPPIFSFPFLLFFVCKSRIFFVGRVKWKGSPGELFHSPQIPLKSQNCRFFLGKFCKNLFLFNVLLRPTFGGSKVKKFSGDLFHFTPPIKNIQDLHLAIKKGKMGGVKLKSTVFCFFHKESKQTFFKSHEVLLYFFL